MPAGPPPVMQHVVVKRSLGIYLIITFVLRDRKRQRVPFLLGGTHPRPLRFGGKS
jgi:hypothetical protein